MSVSTENHVTLVGNLAETPPLRFTGNGVPYCQIVVSVNRRVRNQQTNEWESRLDGHFRGTVWRDLAEHVAGSLTKGTRVMVVARVVTRSYDDAAGVTRWVTELEIDDVAASLRWATVQVTKANGAQPQPGESVAPDVEVPPADPSQPF